MQNVLLVTSIHFARESVDLHSSSRRVDHDASVYQHVVQVQWYQFGDLWTICQRSTGRVAAYQIYIEHRSHRVFTAVSDELTCTRARPSWIRSIDAIEWSRYCIRTTWYNKEINRKIFPRIFDNSWKILKISKILENDVKYLKYLKFLYMMSNSWNYRKLWKTYSLKNN